MKREFELPELKIQTFLATDIITASGDNEMDEGQIPG